MKQKVKQQLTERYAEQNRLAAQCILSKAKPGDDGLAIQWARLIVGRQRGGDRDGNVHTYGQSRPPLDLKAVPREAA